MSYHEIKFCTDSVGLKPNILKIDINKIDRSLINRSDISIKNWSVGQPNDSGYYRVLLYDKDPHLYKLNIFYYWYHPIDGEWRSNYYTTSKIRKPVPLWQDLKCSSL